MRLKTIFLICFCILISSCARDVKVITPLEKANYESLTSHQELVDFLHELNKKSNFIQIDTLGKSVEGRIIPYLKISSGVFGQDRLGKMVVLLFAQQHGNEPSGKEALLALARDFATGKHNELLDRLDILLVPQVNPDGAELHQRQNADGVDLNRSHLILNAPETIALRNLFHEYEPYVTVDVHEYQPWTRSWLQHGFIKLFDEQYGVTTNLNTHPSIREFSEDEFIPYADEKMTEAGYTFHNYIVGTPNRIRYSTSNINDGRQGFGILNTFSLILEGKNELTPTGDIKRRTEAQRYAIEVLLRFCSERKSQIMEMIQSARRSLILEESGEFVLTMNRERDNRFLSIPVISVIEVQPDEYEIVDTIVVDIENYFPLVTPGLTTTIPDAYIVPVSEQNIIDLLEQHKVLFKRLEEGDVFRGDYYVIDVFEQIELEELQIHLPSVRKEPVVYIASEGDILIPTAQLRRFLIATALEPQSMHGLLQYDEYEHLRIPGRFPIIRITLPEIAEVLKFE